VADDEFFSRELRWHVRLALRHLVWTLVLADVILLLAVIERWLNG